MIEIIAGAVLAGSLTGIGILAFGKAQVLREMERPHFSFRASLKSRAKKGAAKASDFFDRMVEALSFDLILQKVLSKIRVLSLKLERISSLWLKDLREKTKEKKEREAYWERLTRFSKKKRGEEEPG